MSEFKHYPVMLNEAIGMLDCRKGLIYVDATLGGGGYSRAILDKIGKNGRLISFDVDKEAIEHSKNVLKDYDNLTIVNDSYTNIKKYLDENNIKEITGGIVFDLGASTPQLTNGERGFSFMGDAKLDMRFNQEQDFSAYDIVNTYREADLVRIFSEYGEERFSKRIAKMIVEKRKNTPVKTTKDLVNIILEATPKIKSKIHPATRVFQALRIEVNGELENIKNTLNDVLTLLGNNAIIVVVTFHSLEDRIVKNFLRYHSNKCNCEPNKIICDCPKPRLELLTRKPLTANDLEIRENPPSRSAKLRAAKRINK